MYNRFRFIEIEIVQKHMETIHRTAGHSPIPPKRKHPRVHPHGELWKMLSAVWVHDDFKLLLRLALELHAQSQINTKIGQVSESIH